MYGAIKLLIRPDTLLMLVMAASLAACWWKRHETRRRLVALTVAFALLWLICTPLVGHVADATLVNRDRPLAAVPDDTQAIVILSGYALPADDRGYPARLGHDTVDRCLAGAAWHQRSGRPLVVTGGVVDPESEVPPLGVLMRDLLLRLQVAADDVIVEQRSRTTYENAAECAKLLTERGWRRIVLVTHDRHMPRAAACFRKAGFEVTAAPVPTGGGDFELSLEAFLPNAQAVRQFNDAAHEWLGMLWYWWHGRI